MPESSPNSTLLTLATARMVQNMRERIEHNGGKFGVVAWLDALLELHGPMAADLAGLDLEAARQRVKEKLDRGEVGEILEPERLVQSASERAKERGLPLAMERDAASVILATAGFQLKSASDTAKPSLPSERADEELTKTSRVSTPVLEKLGRDLVALAKAGKLNKLIGREDELDLMIETLCRRTKRNPVLIGPAGVGKTAIVEGLAQRIAAGNAPDWLKYARIFGLQPSVLISSVSSMAELDKLMKDIIEEASQEGIILFFDELHSIVGAGGSAGSSDIASLLKPVLARGELAVIGATTDDEYRRFITSDRALERRFQPLRVQEMTRAQSLEILKSLRDDLQGESQFVIPDEVLVYLVDFAGEFLRNRNFPDKAVDLFEQCVAHARSRESMTVALADAQKVSQRLVGMPLALGERIGQLKEQLQESGILAEDDVEEIQGRLGLTLRGLDVKFMRPNLVALMVGPAAEQVNTLASILASSLFGSSDRVIKIDMSRFLDGHDVTLLLGAPPMYVGYNEPIALHGLVQMPWSVLQLDNVNACHPAIMEIVRQALTDGFFTDSRGTRIYLSDAVVLMTAPIQAQEAHPVGFKKEEQAAGPDFQKTVEAALGDEFVREVDVVLARTATSLEARRRWLFKTLLPDFCRRFDQKGVDLEWDNSIVDWLIRREAAMKAPGDWERLLDQAIGKHIVPFLPEQAAGRIRLKIAMNNQEQVEVLRS